MPELPEVEVVKKSLSNKIVSLRVKNIMIIKAKLRYLISKKIITQLKNTLIVSIIRRSKYLIVNFSNKKSLIIHLGMTGKFFFLDLKKNKIKNLSSYYDVNERKKKHDHLIINFENKNQLIYNDVRKFGFILLSNTSEISDNKHILNLGPEPLTKNFDERYLEKQKKRRNLPIKNCLMNQNFVSGLGNIYVNEILYISKIHPLKNIKLFNKKEILNLIKNTKIILRKSIKLGGTTLRDFQNSDGLKGKFQKSLKVYNREGLICSNRGCRDKIKRILVCNRSTFYCSNCQKL